MSEDIASEYEALLQFLYMAPVGLVQMQPDGEIVLINPLSAQLMMPLSRDGSLANFFYAMEMAAPELRNMAESFTAPSGTICDAFRVQLNAGIPGKEDPKILSVSLIKLDPQRLMAVMSDITLLVKRERQLKQSEAWFNAILTGVTDYALMSLDANGIIESWNGSIERVMQYSGAAVIGKPFSMLYPQDAITADRATDLLRDSEANGWSLAEGWVRRADGTQFWGSSLIAPLEKLQDRTSDDRLAASHLPGYALIVRDISDQRQSTASMLRAIMSDHLTGVANRRAFFEAAELEIKRWQRAPRPLALLAIDADRFKAINDTYGHAAGDAVLKNMAATLTDTVRKIDTVARIGGEEFVVLLPSTTLDEAATLAERIRVAIAAQCVLFEEAQIRYSVSIGVSAMADQMPGLDAMLKAADTALYGAKKSGRNRVELAPSPGA